MVWFAIDFLVIETLFFCKLQYTSDVARTKNIQFLCNQLILRVFMLTQTTQKYL